MHTLVSIRPINIYHLKCLVCGGTAYSIFACFNFWLLFVLSAAFAKSLLAKFAIVKWCKYVWVCVCVRVRESGPYISIVIFRLFFPLCPWQGCGTHLKIAVSLDDGMRISLQAICSVEWLLSGEQVYDTYVSVGCRRPWVLCPGKGVHHYLLTLCIDKRVFNKSIVVLWKPTVILSLPMDYLKRLAKMCTMARCVGRSMKRGMLWSSIFKKAIIRWNVGSVSSKSAQRVHICI